MRAEPAKELIPVQMHLTNPTKTTKIRFYFVKVRRKN